MPKASVLQFKNYTVEELFYKELPLENDQQQFTLKPSFKRELVTLENDTYDARLSIMLAPAEDAPLPFELHVTIVGHFAFVDPENTVSDTMKDRILRQNTFSILFPFLRQIVATLTSCANIMPLLLPVMNFTEEQQSRE